MRNSKIQIKHPCELLKMIFLKIYIYQIYGNFSEYYNKIFDIIRYFTERIIICNQHSINRIMYFEKGLTSIRDYFEKHDTDIDNFLDIIDSDLEKFKNESNKELSILYSNINDMSYETLYNPDNNWDIYDLKECYKNIFILLNHIRGKLDRIPNEDQFDELLDLSSHGYFIGYWIWIALQSFEEQYPMNEYNDLWCPKNHKCREIVNNKRRSFFDSTEKNTVRIMMNQFSHNLPSNIVNNIKRFLKDVSYDDAKKAIDEVDIMHLIKGYKFEKKKYRGYNK